MTNDDDRVRIETDLAQAHAVSDALDLYSRLAMGQTGEIANLVSQGVIQVRDAAAPSGHRTANHVEVAIVKDLCVQIANALGHRYGAHFGIGADAMGDGARSAYEVQKAVDKAIADHRDPGGMTVRHDGVIVRYTSHPEPKAAIVEHADT